eukprot:3358412-Amphidinium_carterae.1
MSTGPPHLQTRTLLRRPLKRATCSANIYVVSGGSEGFDQLTALCAWTGQLLDDDYCALPDVCAPLVMECGYTLVGYNTVCKAFHAKHRRSVARPRGKWKGNKQQTHTLTGANETAEDDVL